MMAGKTSETMAGIIEILPERVKRRDEQKG
jgi:hypothetical protein